MRNYNMDENQELVTESQKSLQEIIAQVGSQYPIEVINNPESPRIIEVAAVDAEVFGAHKSLTEPEFREIIRQGGVILGHIGPEGKLVSEASLVMSANTTGLSQLERNL